MSATVDFLTKPEALQASGTLNPHPESVIDALFRADAHEPYRFFDAHDLVQVKYEMLRRVRIEQVTVSAAAQAFGFSRVSWYHLHDRYAVDGLVGLLPQTRGPQPRFKKGAMRAGLGRFQTGTASWHCNSSGSTKSCAIRC